MTRHAGANDLSMIDRNGWLPERSAVTALAVIRRLNMRQAFAGRFVAVVTVEAVTNVAGMIEQGRGPGDCLVAVVTDFAGDYVIRRFTAGIESVVARRARFGNG